MIKNYDEFISEKKSDENLSKEEINKRNAAIAIAYTEAEKKRKEKNGEAGVMPIKTKGEAIEWLKNIMFDNELIMGFHPDTDFNDYVDGKGKRMFSKDAAVKLNKKMKECFDVLGDKIYNVATDLVDDFYRMEADAGRPVPDGYENWKFNGGFTGP